MAPQFLVFLNTRKKILKFSFAALLTYVLTIGYAQNVSDITGDWYGVLTQNSGGYKDTYNVELFLDKKGSGFTGIFVVKEKNLTSRMEVKGEWLTKSKVKLSDVRLLEHKEPDGVNWCFKTYLLDFTITDKKPVLNGVWSGKTSTDKCVPGKVYLKKSLPKA